MQTVTMSQHCCRRVSMLCRVSRRVSAIRQEQRRLHLMQGARSRHEITRSEPHRGRAQGYDQRSRRRRSVQPSIDL